MGTLHIPVSTPSLFEGHQKDIEEPQPLSFISAFAIESISEINSSSTIMNRRNEAWFNEKREETNHVETTTITMSTSLRGGGRSHSSATGLNALPLWSSSSDPSPARQLRQRRSLQEGGQSPPEQAKKDNVEATATTTTGLPSSPQDAPAVPVAHSQFNPGGVVGLTNDGASPALPQLQLQLQQQLQQHSLWGRHCRRHHNNKSLCRDNPYRHRKYNCKLLPIG